MPSLSRVARALAAFAFAPLLIPAMVTDAHASSPEPTATRLADPPLVQVDLHGDTKPSKGAGIRKWKGSTLYYHESLPAKWDWSLTTAVAKWNGAGGHIKLVRTSHPARARLFIGYGFNGDQAASSTTGARQGAFILFNSNYGSESNYGDDDPRGAENCIGAMTVLAHELGHVLGFGHTTTACSLMRPTIDMTGCGILPSTRPGYYRCRTIDGPLAKRFVRLYGGKVRSPASTWCLVDTLPEALRGVTFSGGDGTGGPVTIDWQPPRSAPSGSRVTVTRWTASSCTAPRTGARTTDVAPGVGHWVDDDVTTAGSACYAVQLVNRYGAGRAATSHVLGRWVLPPPTAPVIGTPTWDNVAARFHVPVAHEAGTTLVVALGSETDPTDCPGTYSSAEHLANVVEDADRLGEGIGEFMVVSPQECASFYAVDDETGLASAATSVVAEAPLPTETPVVGAISLDHRTWPVFEAPITGAQHGDEIRYATILGRCPETVPSDVEWYSDPGLGTGLGPIPDEFKDIFGLYSRGHGTNCAMFSVFDWFGPSGRRGEPPGVGTRHGPVVMREFTDDGPPAPILGEPTWDAEAGTFSVKEHYGYDMNAAFDPAHPTVCPEPGQTGSESIALAYGVNDVRSFTPPAAEVCVSFFKTRRDLQGVLQNSLPTKLTFVVPSQG